MQYKFYNTIPLLMWAAAVALLWVAFQFPINRHITAGQIEHAMLSEVR